MQLGQLKNLSFEQVKKLYESNRISMTDWNLYCLYRGDMVWPAWKGAKVVQFREKNHLTQFELACILNIDAATIARWESRPDELIPMLGCIAMTHVELFWPNAKKMMMDRKAVIQQKYIRAQREDADWNASVFQEQIHALYKQLEPTGVLGQKIGKRAPISAERIINLRSKLVMTREEFADFLDTSVSTIDKWETAKSLPTGSANMLLRLLEQDQNRSFKLEAIMQLLDRVNFAITKYRISRKYGQLQDSGELKKKIGKRAPISAERIVGLRTRLAMTREQFADFLDTSVSTIDKWESGQNIPKGPANILLRLLEQDQKESFALKQAMQLLDRGGLEFPRQAKK